jgi:CheY-like chemotaxis protein/anti-sigma regulatory factor (Ser/Thr protein kinase)
MLSLINNILDFSKIEAGKLELDLLPFQLHETVEDIVRPLRFQAERKGLRFVCELAPALPPGIVGDPMRLGQVITNLLANAIKFTAKGAITLRVEPEEQAGNDLLLHFAVSDTGIGIPEDKQEAIFEAFTQVDGSISRQFGGTGLGLSIASRLVAKMGGRIWLESAPGQGTTFHFTDRFQVSASRAGQPEPGPGARGADAADGTGDGKQRSLSILLAEDNPVNQMVALRLLQNEGHTVSLAQNGREAVELFGQQPFDAILMDVQMPEMNGYQAAAEIRAKERQHGGDRIRIIALTANAMTGDREKCLASGMDGYISKPFKRIELRRALTALAPEAAAQT